LLPERTPPETIAALQRQALDAAARTGDRVLQSRMIVGLAETLTRGGKAEEAADELRDGLAIAREIGDLSLESRCLAGLIAAERRRDHAIDLVRVQVEPLQRVALRRDFESGHAAERLELDVAAPGHVAQDRARLGREPLEFGEVVAVDLQCEVGAGAGRKVATAR